jgi:hypothetical protein
MGTLTDEECKVMSQAYDLITQMSRIANSQWHQDESWSDLTQVITQRIDSASVRATKTITDIQPSSVWIPKWHPLLSAEDIVNRLCTLFNRLSMILRNETKGRDFKWNETVAAVECDLSNFATIIFSVPAILDPQQKFPSLFVLKDGVRTLPGDKFTRQLLTLYYIFQVQYYIIVKGWSDSTFSEVIETSLAICRLYPSPHESLYPSPDIRFTINRGFWLSLVIAADSRNIKGRFPFGMIKLIHSQFKC